jgi:putative MATE family efflux protein
MTQSRHNVDLTSGSVFRQLLAFAWPVLVADLVSQLYTLTNQLIVGNYLDTAALSAVSASISVTMLANYFFYGVAVADGILTANYCGARDEKNMRLAVRTGLMAALVGGLGFTIVGEIAAPFLMKISNIRPEIHAYAETYLRVYILGYAAVFITNISFFVMRSMGDSRHPLYFQSASCLLNVVLGLVFVGVLHWGVAGTAAATVTAQLVSALLCLRTMKRINPDFVLDLRHPELDADFISRILRLGVPASIQNMLIGLSTFAVQTYVNQFSNAVIAGVGVASRVYNWVQTPTLALATTCSSFVGQNLGSGKYERVHEGIRDCLILALVIAAALAGTIYAFAPQLVSLFDQDPEVIAAGALDVRITVFSFIPLTLSHIFNAACRGAGNVMGPMIIAVSSQCVLRYLVVRAGLAVVFDPRVIYVSAPVCFTAAGLAATLYFYLSPWTREHHLR